MCVIFVKGFETFLFLQEIEQFSRTEGVLRELFIYHLSAVQTEQNKSASFSGERKPCCICCTESRTKQLLFTLKEHDLMNII